MTEVPKQRSFGLNSLEFYEFVRVPQPHVWGPRLPREPQWGRRDDPVLVWVENEADAPTVFQDWQRRVDAGDLTKCSD